MRRISLFGVWACCLALSVGCGGRSEEGPAADPDDDVDIEETTTIVETGCLTAKGDRFVLTALERGGRRAETEMYQLDGNGEVLQRHVGREVRVTGIAEPAQVAEVTERSPATPAGTAGTADGTQPQVQTQAQTRLETRSMRVATVTPTGEDCTEATP
jgi:hypothetical protein